VENPDFDWDKVLDDDAPEEGGWECNMEAIQAANYTSNVVDLMIAALRGLRMDVQRMIGMAATIGAQFDLVVLAMLCDCSEENASVALRTAVR
jgi:predicted ATPase